MSQYINTVDARLYAPKDKHKVIMEALSNLRQGETLQLLNDHDPKPLRYQLDAEHPNQYLWNYVEEGPEVWKVEIKKV